MLSVAKHVLVFTVAVSAECCQARSVPARERPPAFTRNTRNTKNTMNTMNTMFFRGWRSMSHAVGRGAAWRFGYVARYCSQSNARQRCDTYNGERNTSPHTKSPFPPFSPFLSVREPAVFSRRTSVAWRTRALITGGYLFRARPSSVASQLYAATSQARSVPALERLSAFRTE